MPSDVARLEAFVEHASVVLRADPRIAAAWLGGSLAAGLADGYSDVDLRVAVDDAAFDLFVADWPSLPERIAPTVMRRKIGPPDSPIVVAISPDWLRFDIAVARASAAPRPGDRLLFDRRSDPPGAPAPPTPGEPSARLSGLVEEFLRVLGLTRVVLGREEYVLAAHGAALLRWSLVELLLIENAAQRGGMLHLNPYLTADQRALLEATPPIAPTRESALEANAALARAFLPRARRLMAAHGQPYPEEFERATSAYLRGLIDL